MLTFYQVHFYFSKSPFFDRSSKNGVLFNQAQFNPSMAYILFNRDAFERRLQEMSGIEYLIANDTPELRSLANESNGIWVIRKQDRKTGSLTSDLKILGTYFIVNENVFMASSLGDIINNRLVSTAPQHLQLALNSHSTYPSQQLTCMLAVNRSLTAINNLPYFTPSTGHSYFPPLIRSTQLKDDGTSTAAPSREGSPSLIATDPTSSHIHHPPEVDPPAHRTLPHPLHQPLLRLRRRLPRREPLARRAGLLRLQRDSRAHQDGTRQARRRAQRRRRHEKQKQCSW